MHTLPELRSSLIGGYDRLVADIHLWTGVVFISFPILAVYFTRNSVLKSLCIRIFKDPTWHWRRVNLICTILICFFQACAGTMIWVDTIFPMPLVLLDVLFFIHHTGAWYIGLMLPIHFWMARKTIVRTLRAWFGLAT